MIEISSFCQDQPHSAIHSNHVKEKHIQDLLNRTLFASAQVEIPTPIVKVVEEYDKDPNLKPFIRPQSYIRVNGKTILY